LRSAGGKLVGLKAACATEQCSNWVATSCFKEFRWLLRFSSCWFSSCLWLYLLDNCMVPNWVYPLTSSWLAWATKFETIMFQSLCVPLWSIKPWWILPLAPPY
jgi:hypothetical protein